MSPRKSLNLLAVAILASIASGCASNAGSTAGQDSKPGGSGQGSATAAQTAAGSTSLAVNVGYAQDLRDYSNTVVVPTAYVKFLVDGKVFVSKQGSALSTLGGGSANSVKASAKYKVAGLDKAMAQGIAKQAYDDFVAKLRAAGYTVLTYDDIKDRDYMKSAARDKGDAKWGLPTESPVGSSDTYVIAAPSDAQQIKIGFTGAFAEFISLGKPKIKDATIVIPTYTIVSPQVWGTTDSGFNRIEAGISTAAGMNLQYASAIWMGKPKVRMGGGNVPGVVTKAAVINITEKAGELVKAADTTPTAANALSKGLSMLSGAGSINASSAEYTFNVDRTAYTAGALKGITDFNAEVGKAASSAK